MARDSESGLPIEVVYGSEALEGWDPEQQLGVPGGYPFTRGVYPSMYTGRPWTMRQYAGFGTATESNERYHRLVEAGTGGLSVAFDLPTQMGYDSDDAVAHGEVGKVGVAIDSIDDMRTLFDGIPLDEVSTSMTINAPAALLLLLYQLVAEEQGVDPAKLTGTIQNDVLKEYIARGTYIYPPKASLRLITDIFGYCHKELPRWNTISISGYHMAEAGATPAQEVAFTLANAREYVRAALAAGLAVDDFAPRLSFFFVSRTTLLEEVAKFRAARRIWAQVMRDEFGAKDPKSLMLRFHTQTAGVQLTAQQPEVNMVRVAVQALAAVLGGTQSLHTNSYDEAIALPTEKAARLALRTQQVIAYESDVTATVDPFAGSYVGRVDDRRHRGRDPRPDDDASRTSAVRWPRSSRATRSARSSESAYDVVLGDRGRLPHGGRGQPVPAGGRRGLRAAEGRPHHRGPAGGPARRAASRQGRRGGEPEPRGAAGGGRGPGGCGEPAVPDAGRAAGPRHRRRGVQRAARRVGRLPAGRRVLTTSVPAGSDT